MDQDCKGFYLELAALSNHYNQTVRMIFGKCHKVTCSYSIPYCMCQNEDFFFEDMYNEYITIGVTDGQYVLTYLCYVLYVQSL